MNDVDHGRRHPGADVVDASGRVGVRGGEDIMRCLASGADFVLLGRAFLYAAAALGGARGPAALIALLGDELDRAMTQSGCRRIAEIDGALLHRPGDSCGGPGA